MTINEIVGIIRRTRELFWAADARGRGIIVRRIVNSRFHDLASRILKISTDDVHYYESIPEFPVDSPVIHIRRTI